MKDSIAVPVQEAQAQRAVGVAVRSLDPVAELAYRLRRAREAAIELAAWLVAPKAGQESPVYGRIAAEQALAALAALEALAFAFAADPERGPDALVAEARARAAGYEGVLS